MEQYYQNLGKLSYDEKNFYTLRFLTENPNCVARSMPRDCLNHFFNNLESNTETFSNVEYLPTNIVYNNK